MDGGLYLIVFTLTHILDAAGANSGEVALVFGIYTLAYAAIAPWLGGASDAQGRQRSVLEGAVVFTSVALALSAGITVQALPQGLTVLARIEPLGVKASAYLGIACLALSSGLFWPAFQARIGDRERDPEALGRAIRSFNIGWTSGKASGFLAAGFLFHAAPQACLPVSAGCGFLICLLVLVDGAPRATGGAAPLPPAPEEPRPSTTPQAIKRRYLLAALVANFALWGALATLKGLAPKLGEALHLSVQETGVFLFAALGAQGAGFFLLGGAERWAYRPAVLATAVPTAIGGLLLLFVAGGLPLALLGAVLIGLAQAVTYAASVFYSLDYDERRGFRTGIHEAVLGVGGALPILGGFAADATGELRAPLVFMAGVALLAAGLVAWKVVGGRGAKSGEEEKSREEQS